MYYPCSFQYDHIHIYYNSILSISIDRPILQSKVTKYRSVIAFLYNHPIREINRHMI